VFDANYRVAHGYLLNGRTLETEDGGRGMEDGGRETDDGGVMTEDGDDGRHERIYDLGFMIDKGMKDEQDSLQSAA